MSIGIARANLNSNPLIFLLNFVLEKQKIMIIEDKGKLGEDFVNTLAYRSFLKYWCFPGPKYENGDKKEICDLLIIFNSVLIVISVKNYEFKGNHFRYFNNTIEKAVKQIHGACRTLFGAAEVQIKHPDREMEIFPREQITKVFRIVINLGEGVKFYPFNHSTKNDDYVTLFDKDSFETIISQLDTIPDFIDYLEKREKLFKGRITIIMPGDEYDFPLETQKEFFALQKQLTQNYILISGTEKDLLSHFFKNARNFPPFLNDDSNGIFLQIDGDWDSFSDIQQVKNKAEADKASYFIDDFVQNEILKNEYLQNLTPMRLNLAKAMLSFDRLTRRSIAKSYFEFHNRYKDVSGLNFGRRFGDYDGVGVLFTFYTDQMDMEMINTLNTLAIESVNLFTGYKSKSLILISSNRSHRFFFAHIDKIEKYEPDHEEMIRQDVKRMGWFTKHTLFQGSENEFPE
ncbi:hypothetical protein NYQ10_15450 [Flavobacterium johnsoniae]|uniref:hypothetical protein n=1 Tax=Flavobacterium johnsoniae TaxID=986 RepID=UPI0025AF2254|nr:hypothetical protein [Flavobacterium johnsoniae]WJS93486.1 hypothetical protein NYQ10_15450 [Flavobacterium johnsoniae]